MRPPNSQAYWRARDRFLEAGAALPEGLEGRKLIEAAAPALLEVIRMCSEFDPAYQPLLRMAVALRSMDPRAGDGLLAQIADAAPNRDEARRIMARLR